MEIKPVTHVIFDLDGLLLDTDSVYNEVYQEIITRHGKDFTDYLKMQVMGEPFLESSNKIIQELDLPMTTEEFMTQCEGILETALPNIQLMPGAKKLLEHLHAKKVPMALCTGTHPEGYHMKVDKLHRALFSLLSHKTFGTDPNVNNGKPCPDIYLVAASKFEDKPKPGQCLVFEDSEDGVQSAVAAGMQVVMVPIKEVDKHQTNNATLVLKSLRDFKPELFGLPKYQCCQQ